jgi:hypothetical protein
MRGPNCVIISGCLMLQQMCSTRQLDVEDPSHHPKDVTGGHSGPNWNKMCNMHQLVSKGMTTNNTVQLNSKQKHFWSILIVLEIAYLIWLLAANFLGNYRYLKKTKKLNFFCLNQAITCCVLSLLYCCTKQMYTFVKRL